MQAELDSREVVFKAVNELWSFLASIALHDIWIQRLRPVDDPTVPELIHLASSRVGFRRSVIRFRG
uniref:Polyketide synthase n=1 Tax=Peronospora matthiolae TaxID=2874970 RepID=A0AAV1VNI5_9STRA